MFWDATCLFHSFFACSLRPLSAADEESAGTRELSIIRSHLKRCANEAHSASGETTSFSAREDKHATLVTSRDDHTYTFRRHMISYMQKGDRDNK